MSYKNHRIIRLEKVLSSITCVDCEITIHNEKKFTISFEGKNATAEAIIEKYFKSVVNSVTPDYDMETDFTCVRLCV